VPTGKPPEPLSRAALAVLRREPRDSAKIKELFRFMTTERTERVYNQLQRYCRGEQDGVSILIAGTRGMGKTTFTKLVVQMLIAFDTGLIPLPLILHGPTLLKSDLECKRETNCERSPSLRTWSQDEFDEEREKERLKEQVLRELIASLYRHVCTHIVEAWENVIDSHNLLTPRQRSRLERELQHLKGHLELKLDEPPTVVELRKIWRRAGLRRRAGALPHLYRSHERELWPTDQAIREITALASCAQIYEVMLGVMEETRSNTKATTATTLPVAAKSDTEAKSPASEAKRSDVKDWVPQIAPAALAAAATSAIGLTGNSIGALLAGALVYVFGLAAPRFMRRDQSEDLRRERVLKIDWGVKRLEREFPILLRRIKAAGFAPIFVIDELDKLKDTRQSLHHFLDLSKHIARDHAAFLFLTHRDYFEELQPRSADIPGSGG
jgi:hypothetical protein